MNLSTLTLPASLVLAMTPAYAQCGGGHSSHGGYSQTQDHSARQESAPKVRATNTICPVMGESVKSGRDREVAIRGKYYLVCCGGCGPEMSENYDKYLDKEGRPLNAPSEDGATPAKKDEKPVPPAPPAHGGHRH